MGRWESELGPFAIGDEQLFLLKKSMKLSDCDSQTKATPVLHCSRPLQKLIEVAPDRSNVQIIRDRKYRHAQLVKILDEHQPVVSNLLRGKITQMSMRFTSSSIATRFFA